MSTVEAAAPSTNASEGWLTVIQRSVGAHESIEIVETETSWVYLTDKHAYKIKKPVDVGASRNVTAARRRQAYLDEFWLNQRLAPGVYLGVLPITQEKPDELKLNGKGPAIEFAIKMRRLPTEHSLHSLLLTNAITPKQTLALAQTLGRFYETVAPVGDTVDALRARLARRINLAARQLQLLKSEALRQKARTIRAAQQSYVEDARMVLNVRVCDGRVVDGHGDLRPEHVYFDRQPLVIDCLEYNPDLRTLDAMDDLSQLVVGCERLGRPDVGEVITGEYARLTGDAGFPHLEAFYKSLRATELAGALVRQADVRPARTSGDASKYLKLALHYSEIFA